MDSLRLRFMKNQPTLVDLASPHPSKDAELVFRVAFKKAQKEQNKLLRRAKALERKASR